MPLLAAIALLLAGCDLDVKGAFKGAGRAVKKVAGSVGGFVAEYTVCPLELESIIECGHVFQCEGTSVVTPSGYVEICIDDDDKPEQLDEIEALYGECSPTPRHQGLCSYCCGAGCGRGCNGYSGCYCPEPAP